VTLIVDSSSNDRHVVCDLGHRHWGAEGAAGLLLRHLDANGTFRYLLQHRARGTHQGGTWSTPGGALQPRENPVAGALREAAEELGLDLASLAVVDGLQIARLHVEDCGGWRYTTVVADITEQIRPQPANWESDAYGWYTAEEVVGLALHPGFAKSWSKIAAA
jgi:8-oxo-dGTP diphosphatase